MERLDFWYIVLYRDNSKENTVICDDLRSICQYGFFDKKLFYKEHAKIHGCLTPVKIYIEIQAGKDDNTVQKYYK